MLLYIYGVERTDAAKHEVVGSSPTGIHGAEVLHTYAKLATFHNDIVNSDCRSLTDIGSI